MVIRILVLALIASICAGAPLGCAYEVGDQPPVADEVGGGDGNFGSDDEAELGRALLPIVNGDPESGTNWGVMRLGTFNIYADGSDTSWHWFCSAVLYSNAIAVTAKHCVDGTTRSSSGKRVRNFISNPSDLWVHMKTSSGFPFRQASSVAALANSDIAVISFSTPFPMWNSNARRYTTTDYVRPIDMRSTSQMVGSLMVCFGMGGTSTTNIGDGEVTWDLFRVDFARDSLQFGVPATGMGGGTIVNGDSGGPCLYLNALTSFERLPLSGIMSYNSGGSPSREMCYAFWYSLWQG